MRAVIRKNFANFVNQLNRYALIGLFVAFLLFHWLILPPLPLHRAVPAWLAALSMTSMALTFVLAARWRWIELLTGGLDKSYRLHRLLGFFALVTMLGHWALVPGGAGVTPFPLLAEFGEEAGEVAVTILLVAIFLSAVRLLPYRAWKYTHYLMGPAFLIAVLHTFLSDIPLFVGSFAWNIMAVVSIIGAWAWFEKLYRDLKRQPTYEVSDIKRVGDAAIVVFQPLRDPIQYKAGQFAFVSFNQKGLKEMHPFSNGD